MRKINDLLRPAPLGKAVIKGSVAYQMERFFFHRVLSDEARKVIYRETEDAFRTKFDGSTAVGWWQGEFWGKWVISACRVCAYTGDQTLSAHLLNAGRTLLSLAREDGYIGTYEDSENVFPADPEKTLPLVGWPRGWNWNVWCRKYTLWGLLEIYSLTGEQDLLCGAARFADQLIAELGKLGVTLHDVGTFNGLPAGSILKPMLLLYESTGDRKYLDFCIREADLWDDEGGILPNIIRNSFSSRAIPDWYPAPETWTKAYEMMSCLDGLLELYRVTGNERYLEAAKNCRSLIRQSEWNAVFGVSCNDVFYHAADYQNASTEPCDLIHYLRLCYELYVLTADVRYVEDMESVFYNSFLAASFDDGQWGARAVRSSGRHQNGRGQAMMRYSHCCVNNMPRGYLNVIQCFAMGSEDTLYLNLFTDYEGEIPVGGGTARVAISGSYLADGRVQIILDAPDGVNVRLRIPEWSRETFLRMNGEEKRITSHGYDAFAVGAGRTAIDVRFDMNPRIEYFAGNAEKLPPDHYAVKRFLDKDHPEFYDRMAWGRYARCLYGPTLLCRSKKNGNTEEEMFFPAERSVSHGEPLPPENASGFARSRTEIKIGAVRYSDQPDEHTVRLHVDAEIPGTGKTLSLCDFATGSNHFSDDDPNFFSIWL